MQFADMGFSSTMTSDYERHNPYAPPAEAAKAESPEPLALTRAEAIKLLQPPAVGLMISVWISFAWGSVIVADEVRAGDHTQSKGWYLFTTIVSLMAMAVLIGSIQVLRGKTKIWPWVAIVPGLIPFGLTCLTVPCAFWLLHRMLRKDIRAALATTKVQ